MSYAVRVLKSFFTDKAYGRWPLMGFLGGILFGILDSVIDVTFFYPHQTLINNITTPESSEIFMRFSVLLLFTIFGLFTGYYVQKIEDSRLELEKQKLHLENEIKIRKKTETLLKEQASIDPLTSIYNRRKFIEFLEHEINSSFRYSRSLTISILDIDHFKKVNDQLGHLEGDRVLVKFCSIISKSIRKSDIFARLGGEEFVIITPQTNLENGFILADKLRRLVAEKFSSFPLPITVSIGVTSLASDDDLESLLHRADEALYRAKHEGRNRVCQS